MIQGMRILVTRTDRLGDVLLCLPTLQYLSRALPQSKISFLIQPHLHPILAPYLTELGISLISQLEDSYEVALVLYGDRRILKQLRSIKIPLRIGNYSKWDSWFLLSKGEWQRRSLAKQNEALYNLDLAKLLVRSLLGRSIDPVPTPILLPMNEEARGETLHTLSQWGLSEDSPYLVVHPGMGKSALNLSPDTYIKLIHFMFKRTSLPIILSQGPTDYDQRLCQAISLQTPMVQLFQNHSLAALMELFRGAQLVLAPSTGPLHLAHYVGTKTFGIYSPVRSQKPTRWAPFGGRGCSQVASPNVQCPAKSQCLGTKCKVFPCMERENWKAPLETHLFASQ